MASTKTAAKPARKTAAKKAVWNKKNPVKEHKHLTPAQKETAKKRAAKAGRPYPNMVDNMAVAKGEGATSKTGKASDKSSKSAAAKKPVAKKTATAKKATAKKPATKKITAAKKPAAKKTAAKSTAKKAPAKKTATDRKPAAKKPGPKKGSTRKTK